MEFDAAARMQTCSNHRHNDSLQCSGVGDQRNTAEAQRLFMRCWYLGIVILVIGVTAAN